MTPYERYQKERGGATGASPYQRFLTERGVAPKTSLVSKLATGLAYVRKPIEEMAKVWQAPQTPKSWKSAFASDESAKRAWETWSTTIDDTSRRLNKMMDSYKNPNYSDRFLLNAGVSTASAGIGLVNSAFAGITGLINSLTVVPGVGHIADGVNKLFGAAGVGLSTPAVDALYTLPLDDKTKEKLEPVVAELASLAGMALGGKATHKTFETIKRDSTTILKTIKENANPTRNVPVRSTSPEARRVPVSTSRTRYDEYRTRMGYEPYPDPASLPTIDFGARSERSQGPTIQLGSAEQTTPRKLGSFIYEPIREERTSLPSPVERPEPPITPIPRGSVYASYENFQSKTSLGVKARAEAEGYTMPDVPFQPRKNMAADYLDATEFVKRDRESAFRTVEGRKKAPRNIEEGSIFKALEDTLVAEGDVAGLLRLQKTNVGTRMGRGLKFLDRTDGTTSVVAALEEVSSARAKIVESIDKKSVVKKLKKEHPLEEITPDAWESFIKSIEC